MKTQAEIIENIKKQLEENQIKISSIDDNRPWGGFFVIQETSTQKFLDVFFKEQDLKISASAVSPKILFVAPQKKLSWQYHYRRSELWKLVDGEAAVSRSENDTESKPLKMQLGSVIRLAQGERHRLIGLNNWGVVAEVWVHSDPLMPSDENDIIRLQDDFGRN
jgi:mannose-6-phosphate isomerase-like protein (cupin superfamily)